MIKTTVCIFSLFFYLAYSYSAVEPDVTVAGFVKMADGLGRLSVELIDVLKDEFDVTFYQTRLMHDMEDVPVPIHEILKQQKCTLGKVIIFEDTLFKPAAHVKKLYSLMTKEHLKIAYSMCESSKIPSFVVDQLENFFDAVVVPDPYLVKVYRDSGVQIPIFMIPLGLNLTPFIEAPLKSKKQTPFVFGSFSACELRKNNAFIAKAFALAFSDREDVVLKINARHGDEQTLQQMQNEISQLGALNISFSVGSVDQKQYLHNFKSIDCYVNLTKGEGFSIQPREALALGIPVIVSNNTAQTTICSTGLVSSVSSEIEEKAIPSHLRKDDYGSYFNVSLEDAVEAFKDMYTNYETYLSRSQEGREWVKQYEYKNLKPLYFNLVKPKKIIFGDRNEVTQDILMTSSLVLYEKYLKLYPELNTQ